MQNLVKFYRYDHLCVPQQAAKGIPIFKKTSSSQTASHRVGQIVYSLFNYCAAGTTRV